MRPLLTAAWVALAAWPVHATEPVARGSEELLSPREAWATSGLRLSLSFDYELMLALDPAPTAHTFAPSLRIGWRVGRDWSLLANLRYSAALAGLTGVRASVTVDPVWHVNDELELSAGVGYVGTLLDDPDPAPVPLAKIDAAARSGRDPEGLPAFGHCDGHGLTALLRAAYLWRIGSLFATGPTVLVDGQWVSCRDDDYVVRGYEDVSVFTDDGELFTSGPTVELHQSWFHFTVAAGWVFAWR